ncbi:MAG TPA: hypothetical protein VFV67_19845 [Actinophytocola sp.]|uniref:hypothetical protein n=1 Tax=Actinophytocola sp. TaxID=1872138 RepID=UPI002DBE2ABD|nr:hypothetical protein [Actinophytocola sp.]HEU5472903.1 hypothetical protein [Actinophytocola sp.]
MSDGRPSGDQAISLLIEGALDLGRVRQHVRLFLSGVGEPVVADVVLVTVMLASDSFRYGDPPITLRLQFLIGTGESRLRIEVDHHQDRALDTQVDSRTGILDRITSARGENRHDDRTTVWAEIPLPTVTEHLAG